MIKEIKYGTTNTYLIKGRSGTILFDTGWAGTLAAFCHAVGEAGEKVQDINYILISHYHPDHMGIVQDIIDNMNVKLLVIDVQKDYIHCSDQIFEKNNNINFNPISTEPLIISCKDSRKFLNDLGIDGEIIYTPGHSDDSISLILDNGIALVGDLYDLNSAFAFNDEKINNSWKNILSHNISKICYGHHEQIIN